MSRFPWDAGSASSDYKLQLFQGQTTFEVIYGARGLPSSASIGVQRDLVDFTVFQNASQGNVTLNTVIPKAASVNTTVTFSLSDVPEPGTFVLIGLVLLAIPAICRIRA